MKDVMTVFRSPKVVFMTLFAFFTLSLAACGPGGGGEGGEGSSTTEGSETGG